MAEIKLEVIRINLIGAALAVTSAWLEQEGIKGVTEPRPSCESCIGAGEARRTAAPLHFQPRLFDMQRH